MDPGETGARVASATGLSVTTAAHAESAAAAPSINFMIPFAMPYSLLFKSVDPNRRAITNSEMKTKNRILAMDAAPAAMPPNPNKAAIIAMIKKISA